MTEEKSSTSSNNAEGWLYLLGLVVVVCIILWLLGCNFGQTSEGYVDNSDCRVTIDLKKGDWQTYFGKFVCNGYGSCSKLIIKNGKCETEYNYYIDVK